MGAARDFQVPLLVEEGLGEHRAVEAALDNALLQREHGALLHVEHQLRRDRLVIHVHHRRQLGRQPGGQRLLDVGLFAHGFVQATGDAEKIPYVAFVVGDDLLFVVLDAGRHDFTHPYTAQIWLVVGTGVLDPFSLQIGDPCCGVEGRQMGRDRAFDERGVLRILGECRQRVLDDLAFAVARRCRRREVAPWRRTRRTTDAPPWPTRFPRVVFAACRRDWGSSEYRERVRASKLPGPSARSGL